MSDKLSDMGGAVAKLFIDRPKLIFLLGLIIIISSKIHAQNIPSILFPSNEDSVKVSVSVFDNVIYLPVKINGVVYNNFILDTGAPELTIFDSKIVDELILKLRNGGNLKGAGKNSVKFQLLDEVHLDISGIKINDYRAGSFSLKHMEPYWGRKKDGLIGGNILSDLITLIDYDDEYLIFYKYQENSLRNASEFQRVPLAIKDNSLFMDAVLGYGKNGKTVKAKFLIDTAVRKSFINSPFVKKYNLIQNAESIVENITGFGVGGEGFGKLGRIESIKIGPFKIGKPIFELTMDTKGIATSKSFDGILGADVLSRFDLIIDYKNEALYLKPNDKFSRIEKYDMSGMFLIKKPNKFYEIRYIVKNSPAEEAEIKIGDLVLEIDKVSTANYNYEEIKNYLKVEDRIVHLKIKRGENVIYKKIKLRKLL